MNQEREMRAEREYLERVKMRLLDTIDEARALSSEHAESIRMITADAWEELRVRPTQISQMEMQQLATECDRFSARKAFAEEEARRAEKMLPFRVRRKNRIAPPKAAGRMIIVRRKSLTRIEESTQG